MMPFNQIIRGLQRHQGPHQAPTDNAVGTLRTIIRLMCHGRDQACLRLARSNGGIVGCVPPI